MSLAKRALEKQKIERTIYRTDKPMDLSNFAEAKSSLQFTKHKEKVTKMAKTKVTNTGELIVFVTAVADPATGKTSYVSKEADGTEHAIDQKKLRYAFSNKGVVRGRPTVVEGVTQYTWRVVKEKFVNKVEVSTELTVKPKASKTPKTAVA